MNDAYGAARAALDERRERILALPHVRGVGLYHPEDDAPPRILIFTEPGQRVALDELADELGGIELEQAELIEAEPGDAPEPPARSPSVPTVFQGGIGIRIDRDLAVFGFDDDEPGRGRRKRVIGTAATIASGPNGTPVGLTAFSVVADASWGVGDRVLAVPGGAELGSLELAAFYGEHFQPPGTIYPVNGATVKLKPGPYDGTIRGLGPVNGALRPRDGRRPKPLGRWLSKFGYQSGRTDGSIVLSYASFERWVGFPYTGSHPAVIPLCFGVAGVKGSTFSWAEDRGAAVLDAANQVLGLIVGELQLGPEFVSLVLPIDQIEDTLGVRLFPTIHLAQVGDSEALEDPKRVRLAHDGVRWYMFVVSPSGGLVVIPASADPQEELRARRFAPRVQLGRPLPGPARPRGEEALQSLAVEPRDGLFWVAEGGAGAKGTQRIRVYSFQSPQGLRLATGAGGDWPTRVGAASLTWLTSPGSDAVHLCAGLTRIAGPFEPGRERVLLYRLTAGPKATLTQVSGAGGELEATVGASGVATFAFRGVEYVAASLQRSQRSLAVWPLRRKPQESLAFGQPSFSGADDWGEEARPTCVAAGRFGNVIALAVGRDAGPGPRFLVYIWDGADLTKFWAGGEQWSEDQGVVSLALTAAADGRSWLTVARGSTSGPRPIEPLLVYPLVSAGLGQPVTPTPPELDQVLTDVSVLPSSPRGLVIGVARRTSPPDPDMALLVFHA